MSESPWVPVYEIVEWEERYEVSTSERAWKPGQQKRAGPLFYIRQKVHGRSWGSGWRKLINLAGPRVFEVFGGYCKAIELAADNPAEHRGTLPSVKEYTELCGVPQESAEFVIKAMLSLGWIRKLRENSSRNCGIPQKSALEEKRREEKRREKKSSSCSKTALFSSFWEAYPKKVGKAPALKAFLKLDVSRAMVDRMVAAIEEQAQSRQWREKNGEYIPHPEKWLNDARWEDEGTSLPDQEPEFVPPTQEQLDYLDALDAEKAKANAKPKL